MAQFLFFSHKQLNMQRIKIGLGVLLSFILLAADAPSTSTPQTIAARNNAFAFDLYHQVSQKQYGNIFFSPSSISTALAMTYAGAAGQTATEMQKALHFGPNQPQFHLAYGDYLELLDKHAKGNIALNMANRLWAEKHYNLSLEYKKLNKRAYNSPVEKVDFMHQPEESRNTINAWVEEKTEERIKDLLPSGSVSVDTRLVITNAIYFKGDWLYQFKKKHTKNKSFYLADGEKIKVPFMRMIGAYSFWATETYQLIKLPYKGSKQSMVVVLPKEGVSITEVEKQVNSSSFSHLSESYMPQVELALPKFKMTQPLGLGATLQQMGMPTAFSNRADFSQMTGTSNNLAISEVFHKAFIQVDEEGTEAAAATAVVMVLTSTNAPKPKPIQFTANRPFLFYIIDDETQSILFMGRMMKPEWTD